MLHLSRPTCGILETGCMAVYNMMMNIFKCLFYAAQGYSVQYLFEGFMLPKRSVSRYQSMKCNKWLAGSVWIVTEMMADLLFSRVNRKPQFTIMDIVQSGRFKIGKTLLCSIVLYLFCLCWYQGKWLLKLFLVIQFLSLRQLSIWTGFSLNLLGQRKLSQLEHAFLEGKLQMTEFVQYAELAGLCSVVVVWLLQCTVLILFIRKIVKSFCCWEPERLNREAAIYLLPAVTGLLLDLLLRMMMITMRRADRFIVQTIPCLIFCDTRDCDCTDAGNCVQLPELSGDGSDSARAGRENRAGKPDDTDAGFYRRNGTDVLHNAFCQA